MECLFIASMEKKKIKDMSISNPSSIPILPFSSRKAVKRSTTQFPPKKQRLRKLLFSAETGLSETLLGPG